MAAYSLSAEMIGYVTVNLKIQDNSYPGVKLSVLKNHCADVIIGLNILQQHDSLDLKFVGSKPPRSICGLTTVSIEPPLFVNVPPESKQIATKSRRYGNNDKKSISGKVQSLLQEDIIGPSTFPWRPQIIVTTNERHKRCMVIDYSRTVNR